MAITADQIGGALQTVFASANTIKDFSKLARRNSIMKMAAPAMYQYPILMSNAIETPVAMAIAQAFQQTYACSVATAYSLNPIMALKDYREPSDFVQKFHNNNIVPTNFSAAANALGVESAMDINDIEVIAIDGATINRNFSKEAMESMSIKAWDRIEDHVDTETLNNMYLPYTRTSRILSEKVVSLQTANEALKDTIKDGFDNAMNFMDDVNDRTVANKNNMANRGLNKDTSTKLVSSSPSIAKKDRLEAMEPTMVDVQIVCHGKGAGQFTHNLIIGVKTMVRLVTSDLMVATMVEACKESHGIFRFLKWTKGEQKTLDFVLGISSAKKRVLEKNAKMEVRVLKQSQKRGKFGILKRALNNDVFPILTVVLTTYEVERIKEICGVDLTDYRQATNLMNKYYLLAFAIYDQTQNTLQSIVDCDDDWSVVSVGSMKSMLNKLNDALNQKEAMALLGKI